MSEPDFNRDYPWEDDVYLFFLAGAVPTTVVIDGMLTLTMLRELVQHMEGMSDAGA